MEKIPYQCKMCDGNGIIQSENGDKSIVCPQCQGLKTYNPFKD